MMESCFPCELRAGVVSEPSCLPEISRIHSRRTSEYIILQRRENCALAISR